MVGKIMWTFCTILVLAPAIAGAQTTTTFDRRHVVFAEIGYARTIHDEGLLGDGGSGSGGYGYRLTPGKTIQGLVSYASYYHEGVSSTFDGRALFVGAEIAFQSTRPRFRPFVTVGAGVLDFDDTRVNRREISPGRTMVDPPIARVFTLPGMTGSGGIDFYINEHASIRAGVRIHGVLGGVTAESSSPFMIFRPSVGAAFRW
jgi:hypothetical protein